MNHQETPKKTITNDRHFNESSRNTKEINYRWKVCIKDVI